eukprot:jgi/Galph1/3870/GphlegSOOS_G2534.1
MIDRIPAKFLLNDHLMNWLLEEPVERGLTAELIFRRGLAVRSSYGYLDEAGRLSDDVTVIVPCEIAGSCIFCYVYGPPFSFPSFHRESNSWNRLVIDLLDFSFLQVSRCREKILCTFLIERISSTRFVETTSYFFKPQTSVPEYRILNVVAELASHCLFCGLSSGYCRCDIKRISRENADLWALTKQNTQASTPTSGLSFSAPVLSGSLLESISTSRSTGFINISQYSVKEGNLLKFSRRPCCRQVASLTLEALERSLMTAVNSLVKSRKIPRLFTGPKLGDNDDVKECSLSTYVLSRLEEERCFCIESPLISFLDKKESILCLDSGMNYDETYTTPMSTNNNWLCFTSEFDDTDEGV